MGKFDDAEPSGNPGGAGCLAVLLVFGVIYVIVVLVWDSYGWMWGVITLSVIIGLILLVRASDIAKESSRSERDEDKEKDE